VADAKAFPLTEYCREETHSPEFYGGLSGSSAAIFNNPN